MGQKRSSAERWMAIAMAGGAIAACSGDGPRSADVATVRAAVSAGQAAAGQAKFDAPTSGTNGRSCATCHVESEHTILTPANAQARYAANPHDPLFLPVDADDPAAATPTYAHVLAGLVRITLPLPANMDVVDSAGSVVTPGDRRISVWRSVPSVDNTSYTAPYLSDGRAATLEDQALGALDAHGQETHAVGGGNLKLIADYESTKFSSARASSVASQFAAGTPVSAIANPEDSDLSSGNAIYVRACKGCHGSATDNRITNRAAHDQLFFALKPDGNLVFQRIPTGPSSSIVVPVLASRPNDEFLNVGFAFISYLGQVGAFPAANAGVSLPHYRFRFYTDATRTQKVTDLPPPPAGPPGSVPTDPATGFPIVGPNFGAQEFSTDPGRALITGDPADFEAFDIPQLRGIASTAPYMHDNSLATLRDVVDVYSRFILGAIPALNVPAVNAPEAPGLPPEALSPSEKASLLQFLQTF